MSKSDWLDQGDWFEQWPGAGDKWIARAHMLAVLYYQGLIRHTDLELNKTMQEICLVIAQSETRAPARAFIEKLRELSQEHKDPKKGFYKLYFRIPKKRGA